MKFHKDRYNELQREIQNKEILGEKLSITERMKTQVEDELIQVKTNYGYHFTELGDQVKTLKKLNEEFKDKIHESEEDLNAQARELMDVFISS